MDTSGQSRSESDPYDLATEQPPFTSSVSKCFTSSTLEPVSSSGVKQFIALLYLATSLVAIVGNLLVILVQAFVRGSRHNIRQYLNHLAVSDIILATVSMPFTYTNIVLGHWAFPRWLCGTSQYAQLLSVFITSTTLSLIGIER